MVLIQKFPSGRSIGNLLEISQKFYSNTKTRSGGWYKNIFYFTEIELENTNKDIMSLSEFKGLIDSIMLTRLGSGIRVTDITTGEVIDYDSMRGVTRAIGIDNKGIRDKLLTGKLYKKR